MALLKFFAILLLVGTSYVLALKALRKRRKPVWLEWILTMATALFSTPLLILFTVGIWGAFTFSYPHRSFDQKRWATSEDSRYEMADDLLNYGKLIGLSKEQVATLLGKPIDLESDEWLYELGYEPKFVQINPSVLLISFRNGKVVECSVEHE